MTHKVTILIPNYKTLILDQLCLRLIRLHTDSKLAKVIVIDNDSNDESLDYLRSLPWIQLIERKSIPNEGAISAHARALDLALKEVDTPYVLSIHTDTLVKRPDWLPFLINHMEKDINIAGVGSWKLELKPRWRQKLKQIERYFQAHYYQFIGKEKHGLEGIGKNYYYLRSHCAMYRMSYLRDYHLHFEEGNQVAGKGMHEILVKKGHQMIFLSSEELSPYVEHINHATTVLNPSLSTRSKSVIKGEKRIKQSLARLNANAILNNTELDN